MTYTANMATRKRGKAPSSSAETESKIPTEDFSLAMESSDDEAPEEVTFEDSRTQALRSMKRALEAARREKELLKEKRRKRQELFQEQKKRKLLPADVLEEIDTAAPKKQESSQGKAEEEQREAEEADEKEDEEKLKVKNKTKKKRKTRKFAPVRNLKGNYTVRTLKENTSSSFQQQAAMDFLQSRLYGPGSCRTTSNELLSLQNKKGQNKSAAVQFVRKDWACKEKAKAEKLKKRWIHKQQISSS